MRKYIDIINESLIQEIEIAPLSSSVKKFNVDKMKEVANNDNILGSLRGYDLKGGKDILVLAANKNLISGIKVVHDFKYPNLSLTYTDENHRSNGYSLKSVYIYK